MTKNVPESRKKAAAIARKAWEVKPKYVAVRGSLRIPVNTESAFNEQSSEQRGSTWADGYLIGRSSLILYRILERLSGHGISMIAGDEVTLIVGQDSFSGESCIDALLKAISFYLALEPLQGSDDALEKRLIELDLLE